MEERNKTDAELEEVAASFNESELFGTQFALFPAAKMPEDMERMDHVRLMELCKRRL